VPLLSCYESLTPDTILCNKDSTILTIVPQIYHTSPICWVLKLVLDRYSRERSFARLVRTGVLGSDFFEVCMDSALTCLDTQGMTFLRSNGDFVRYL
jgi:hypothetical protein